MDNTVLVMYKMRLQACDFIERLMGSGEVKIQTRLGRPYRVTHTTFSYPQLDRVIPPTTCLYTFIEYDPEAGTHQGLCGLVFQGFKFLGDNWEGSVINYCLSRQRRSTPNAQ